MVMSGQHCIICSNNKEPLSSVLHHWVISTIFMQILTMYILGIHHREDICTYLSTFMEMSFTLHISNNNAITNFEADFVFENIWFNTVFTAQTLQVISNQHL
jgi:hypothetical protein